MYFKILFILFLHWKNGGADIKDAVPPESTSGWCWRPWRSLKRSWILAYVPWCSMMFHDVPWCSMMFHDVPWCSMMFHDVPWCSMMFHDVHMMFHDVPWCSYDVPWCSYDFPWFSKVPTGTDMSCCAERSVARCTTPNPMAWTASSPRVPTPSWRTRKGRARGSSSSSTRVMSTPNTSSSSTRTTVALVPIIILVPIWVSCAWHGSNTIRTCLPFWPQNFTAWQCDCGPQSSAERVKLVDAVAGFRMECCLEPSGWMQMMVKTGIMLWEWLKLVECGSNKNNRAICAWFISPIFLCFGAWFINYCFAHSSIFTRRKWMLRHY